MSSAGWKDVKYKQDLPPPGGYGSVPYKRNLPIRGPNGFVLFGVVLLSHGLAAYSYTRKNALHHLRLEEHKQAELCMYPLLEAERDRAMLRDWKENIESEALNIVGTGFDPTYKPGQAEGIFHVQGRYDNPVMEGGSFFFPSIKNWYYGRVDRCGP